jgi:cobalt/nickel transport system permease protein
MVTALIFAVTLFPVPVPIVGMSSHMCATPVLALLLGPRLMALPTALVLAVQALFFAHGGLTTLGANVVTLGVVGPWVAWGLARALRTAGVGPRLTVAVAAALADMAVYAVDAGILALALGGVAGAPTWLPRLLVGLAPTQLPLALVEGALSAWLVSALQKGGRVPLPGWLTADRARPAAAAMAPLLVPLIALAASGSGCAAEYKGLDEVVFQGQAAAAGRESRPVLDLEGGDLGRALFGGAMLTVGLVLGAGWGRLRPGPPEARRSADGGAPGGGDGASDA